MSRTTGAILLLLACAAAAAEDEVTESPHHAYRIVQHYAGNWDVSLRFRDGSHPDVPLARASSGYPWPSVYDISPDDQWIFRAQKTGSGENIALLYHVDLRGRVRRVERRLDDLAFAFLSREHIAGKTYYHVGAEFISWDLPHQALHFRIRGSAEEQGPSHLDRSLIYHLDSREITE